ncbi:HYR domain-containing protein [Rasiella rasia]|uniref:HYR domain-containing protein n=1 Tax=Rasiella rasia TaxID=2744027 RepID=A0A6G6GK98_9FLAO|nr:HYR domain-containing protein [Rasiella rasia]QIE59016.1 HYR domain-containing protein [Rasiella rasia]
MKKTIFNVGLFMALLVGTTSVFAQQIMEYQTLSPTAVAERSLAPSINATNSQRMIPTTIYETTHDGANFYNISPTLGSGASEYISMAGTNRAITEIAMFLVDAPISLTPYDVTINVYSDCNTSGLDGSSCDSGPGVLIPGSTQTITVTPTAQVHEVVFNYTGLDVSSEIDNELTISLSTTRNDIGWLVGNSGRTVGSRTVQEDGFGVDIFAVCGQAINNGCAQFFGPVPPNPTAILDLRVVADEVIAAGPTPEILYYKFEEAGTTVTNEASAPPAGTATATINGGSSQGAPAICGVGALQSNSTTNESMSTGWNTNLGTSSWSIALKVRDIGAGVFGYLMGDFNAGNFRVFANGAAGSNNLILRGPLSEVLAVNGANSAAEATTVFVYDNTVPEIRAYVDGVLVNTVAQAALNISGTDFFVGNRSIDDQGLPVGAALDEFMFFNRAITAAEVAEITACAAATGGMAPEIFCPADIVENNDPGVCGGQVNFLGVALDDEDGNISGDIVATPFESGDVFPVGTTTVTLSVTDSDGNTATCTFDVTILDNEAPTITCPADITQTNDAGVCGANVIVPAPTVMDNCPTTPAPLTIPGFTTLTSNGNSTYYLSDATFSGPDAYIDAVANGGFVVTIEDAAENSLIRDAVDDIDPNSRYFIGYNDVATEGTFEWQSGSTSTFENWAPGQPDDNGPGQDYGVVRLNGRWADVGTNANRKYVLEVVAGTLVNDYNSTDDASDFYPVGTTTVTWTYTDAAGLSASCTMDVTVTDDEAPVIACEGAPTATTATASATPGLTIDATSPVVSSTISVTDEFDITDLNVDLDIPHAWVGDLIVELTGPDGTSVVIVDQPGVPASTFGCAGADILATMDDEATDPVEDECDAGVPTINGSFIPNNPLAAFDGLSTVGDWTLTVTDTFPAGDDGVLAAWGITYEYLAPAGPPFDVVLDANGMATVNVIDLLSSVTDNCGMVTATTDVTGIAPGSITTLFDSNNGGSNGGAVYFDIAVDTGGDVTLTDLDLNTEEGGAFTVEMYTLVGTSVGNEGNAGAWTLAATGSGTASGTLNVPSNAVLDTQVVLTAGTTYGVALVMDATHGHSYSGTGTDPSPGMLMYSNSHMTLSLGSGSNAPFDGAPFTPRIWNGTLNYLANSTTPVPVEMIDLDCSDVGISTLDITVTDAAGNTSMCTATINVIDDTAPILVCQDFTLELGADGTAMLDPFDMIDMAASFEACGFDTAAVNIDDFTCADIGTPIEVTVFVADPSLNSAACTAFVTVVDLLGPEVTCPGDMTVDPGANNQLYEVPDYFGDGLATAVDNCTDPLTIFAQDPAPGSLIPDGVYTVTLSSTDEYGNVGSCTFELTVESILGVNDNNLDAGITMYPNPAQGQVTIANSSNILLEKATMYDVNGKLVNTTNLSDMQGEITIDISNLASGVYIVQIEGENASVVKRLIKE